MEVGGAAPRQLTPTTRSLRRLRRSRPFRCVRKGVRKVKSPHDPLAHGDRSVTDVELSNRKTPLDRVALHAVTYGKTLQMEKIIEQINQLVDLTTAGIEAIIKSPNASPERRVAAILMYVSATDLPIASYTTEFIISLTDPDGLAGEQDPVGTPSGIAVTLHLHDASEDLLNLIRDENAGTLDRTAAQLIMRARTGSIPSNHSLDLVLKATTGKDSIWWLDWIAQNGSHG